MILSEPLRLSPNGQEWRGLLKDLTICDQEPFVMAVFADGQALEIPVEIASELRPLIGEHIKVFRYKDQYRVKKVITWFS